MNTKKLSFFVGAFLASLASNAVTPVFQAYSNGSMMYAFDYNAARTGVAVQVRNKDKPDEPWTTLNGTFSAKWNTTKYALWTFRTNFSHTLEVRIAEITSSGTGDFDAVDDVLCTMPLMGDILTSSSSIGPYAFDGLFNITDTQWAGYDFGSVKRISKIRYIFRFDTGALGWSSRWAGSSFQVASDASFSDASNVATVTTAGYTIDHMQEIEFNPPIETRYIRHWDDSHSSLCECEFISPDFNACIPAPEIADYTFYQTNLVISWSIPAIYAQLSNVLERARSEEGPWTEVSRVLFPGETMCHTDMTAKVGLKYFYRRATPRTS